MFWVTFWSVRDVAEITSSRDKCLKFNNSFCKCLGDTQVLPQLETTEPWYAFWLSTCSELSHENVLSKNKLKAMDNIVKYFLQLKLTPILLVCFQWCICTISSTVANNTQETTSTSTIFIIKVMPDALEIGKLVKTLDEQTSLAHVCSAWCPDVNSTEATIHAFFLH